MKLLAVVVVALAGCATASPQEPSPRSSHRAAPPVTPIASVASSPPGLAPPMLPVIATDPTLHGLLPSALAPSVIAVRGYPHNIEEGNNDPAQWVGWSKDGELFGYCQEGDGRDAQDVHCHFLRRDGSSDDRSSNDAKGNFNQAAHDAVHAWLADNGIPKITQEHASELVMFPPRLAGSWPFGDVTLDVARIAPTTATDGAITVPASLRVGGLVDGEPPVHPIVFTGGKYDWFSAMNGMAVSPDGRELGMVAHFFACEWCDGWEVRRMPLASLASQIYNDSGFRHHRKHEWERAAALFAKAAAADPSAKLPPYNLACALARSKDPRAELALRRAIDLGGAQVAARASTDPDFDGVRNDAWFRALGGSSFGPAASH